MIVPARSPRPCGINPAGMKSTAILGQSHMPQSVMPECFAHTVPGLGSGIVQPQISLKEAGPASALLSLSPHFSPES
jgi:hypothetical protein